MTAQPPSDDPNDKPSPEERGSYYEAPVWKRFYGFLLGPALVAAAALAVFTVISVLTDEGSDPHELVMALRTGGEHRRWQAAFALTKYLQPSVQQQNDEVRRESDVDYQQKLDKVRVLVPELLEIWNDPARGDAEVRRFLALAFSYLGDPRAVPALSRALGDADPELVHYALAALTTTAGSAGPGQAKVDLGAEAITAIIGASRRPEHDIRATAIYALGVLGTPEAIGRLEEAVDDAAPSVKWNAAFALARYGNGAGEKVLLEILDRGPIYQAAGPDPARQRDLFLNAVRSAGMVRSPSLDERLSRIAQADENLPARDLAIKLVEQRRAE